MIELCGLRKAYGGVVVVDDVSFRVPKGSITAFVGPNAAGKSTVLRMIAGLLTPDEGEARIAGRPFRDARHPGRTMGVFLSAETMPPGVRARDYLDYIARLKGLRPATAEEALELVGLTGAARTRIRAMSLGMRQRLGIAAAQLGEPALLVFDEPINGLDPEGMRWFRHYVRRRVAEGATVLLSSHQMAELEHVADRVVMIEGGRIVSEGSVSDFVVSEQSPQVFAHALQPDRLTDILRSRGLDVRSHAGGLLITGAPAVEVGSIAFAEAGGLGHLESLTRSLEQTYFDRLAGDAQPAAQESEAFR